MERVYDVYWDDEACKIEDNKIIAKAWSRTNLFAFNTEKEIDGHRRQYLNVLNPNQPWDVFSILYKGGEINCLEWDRTGTKLLSADSHGKCCVWTPVNNMSNRWVAKSCFGVDLPGENILCIRWLHHGVKVLFHMEKLELTNLNEKFQRTVFKPSVVKCGGKHVDGYVLVTATGLVHVQCMDSESNPTYGQVYLNAPSHRMISDIRFTAQGKIVLATSNGDIQHLIHFHEMQLKYDSSKKSLAIEVAMLPSIAVKCAGDEESVYTRISHIKFLSLDNQDLHVVVCLSSPNGSRFEAWLMRKDNVSVHKIFQQTSSPSYATPEATKAWHYVISSDHLPKVLDICVPSNAINCTLTTTSKVATEVKFYCAITMAVALADNSIRILHRLSLKNLYTQQLNTTEPSVNLDVRCAIFSTLSCAMIIIDDRGRIRLYKLPPWLGIPSKAPLEARKQLVQLLLYCLDTGLEWWEVLLHITPSFANNAADIVATEVNNQTKSFQQCLRSRCLSMRITIFQHANNATATDCHLKLLFEAVSLVFRSLFRPPQQVTSEENDPSLRLRIVCRTSSETDISHYLQSVDAVPQSLLSMQQLIQWIADVTLHLLASVPYHQINKTFIRPCSTLIRDHEWLSLLRELLVIIRVWMLLKNACSPVFHTLDSNLIGIEGVKVLPHAFRLVTMLWQACSPDSPQKDLPATLINECCLLPSQVIIPPLEIVPAVNGVLSHLNLGSRPLSLKFGELQRDAGVLNSRQRKTELVAFPGSSGKIDSLRRVYLGNRPTQELKECTRCGIVTMYNSLGPSLLKMWDQRFVKSCLCGGMWRKRNPG